MQTTQARNRLHALDGLRGFAMILVFLDHINAVPLIKTFPLLDQIGLFGSGVTGVSIFFLLSGFLMAYLYPIPNGIKFIQKRYLRIFPLFLSMCTFMFLLRQKPFLQIIPEFLLLFLVAISVHLFWVKVILRLKIKNIGKTLFFIFLFAQILTGIIYSLWIMRMPPIFFNQQVSMPLREGFIFLTNATLTFPFGTYIPLLDGVYWSLASEILFYIIYPYVLVPLIYFLKTRSNLTKIVFLIALLPFLASLDFLLQRILLLSVLQIRLFYYFAIGIAVAYLFRDHQNIFSKFSNIFSGTFKYVPFILLLVIIYLHHLLNSFVGDFSIWVRLLASFPLGLILAICLNEEIHISKLFSSKIFVFIGTISYSMYLSHSAVINAVEGLINAGSNVYLNMFSIIFSFVLDIFIAYFLYLLLEKPYFYVSAYEKAKNIFQKNEKLVYPAFITKIILIFLFIGVLILVITSFQSNFNFFSTEVTNPKSNVIYPKTITQWISLRDFDHMDIQIDSKEDNLGIISIPVNHLYLQRNGQNPYLIFRIKEKGNSNWFYSTTYVLEEFRGVGFPFGFPTQTSSKNKTYIVEFKISDQYVADNVEINSSQIKSVYAISKTYFFKNPQNFPSFFTKKFFLAISNSNARYVLYLAIPFFLVSTFLISTKEKQLKVKKINEKKINVASLP